MTTSTTRHPHIQRPQIEQVAAHIAKRLTPDNIRSIRDWAHFHNTTQGWDLHLPAHGPNGAPQPPIRYDGIQLTESELRQAFNIALQGLTP